MINFTEFIHNSNPSYGFLRNSLIWGLKKSDPPTKWQAGQSTHYENTHMLLKLVFNLKSSCPGDTEDYLLFNSKAPEVDSGRFFSNFSLMAIRTFLILIPTLAACLLMSSCQKGTDADSVRKARESLQAKLPANPSFDQATPTPPISSTPSGGVKHYICPNNCAGSGGEAQGTCPTCGSAYQHNAAYHNQSNTPATDGSQLPPQSPEPAMNAAGVYHYVCSAGCEGGAGAQGNCAGCGAALTHNAAYHQ